MNFYLFLSLIYYYFFFRSIDYCHSKEQRVLIIYNSAKIKKKNRFNFYGKAKISGTVFKKLYKKFKMSRLLYIFLRTLILFKLIEYLPIKPLIPLIAFNYFANFFFQKYMA
jgi:hypothetical protein